MRIIDKQKDFYDYLVGEYGIDPLYTYVRTSPNPNNDYLIKGTLEYFNSNKKLMYDIPKQRFPRYTLDDLCFKKFYGILIHLEVIIGFHRFIFSCNRYIENDKIHKEIKWVEDTNKFERKSQAPIYISYPDRYNIVGNAKHVLENPILQAYGLASYFDPHDVWRWIVEYLASLKEVEAKPLSDKEKVVSHGFDLKTSFRHPIK